MPVSKLPTKHDCLKFLHSSKNAIFDVERGVWQIGGAEYPEDRAVLLAEYCLITGQTLTSLATIEAALDLARRVVVLETRMTSLMEDFGLVFNKVMIKRKHWWSRG